MKKILFINTLIVLALMLTVSGQAQNSLKIRFGGNATRFTKEPQGAEINFWEIDTFATNYGPFDSFANKFKTGGEVELMMSLSEKTYLGLEISMDKMYGENMNPGLFNFQYTDYLQLQSTDTVTDLISRHITNYPLKYSTRLINLIGNFRIYPVPDARLRPFIKVSAGLSLISTELALLTPSAWIENLQEVNPNLVPGQPVLYSRGTADSEKGIFPAFTFGGGFGFEFQINSKLAAYADYSLRVVSSDIVDGKPNFDWYEETGLFEHFSTRSNLSKFSFGLVYTLNDNFKGLGIGGGGGKGGKRTGRQHPRLPFYEIK